ncbi:MAG: hypothetical protein NVSMB55_25070 [Mycobacteriales bacterium]
MRRIAPLACGPALVALLAVTGCSGSSAKALSAPSDTAPLPSPSTLPSCAPSHVKPSRWPAGIPAELPTLPGTTIRSNKKTADGLQIVQFSTATSLRDGVIFIVRKVPSAGFTLGRGDAEPTEADAPFARGELQGTFRGAATGVCQTTWILAVLPRRQGVGTPLLPAHTGPSPSPLPFG